MFVPEKPRTLPYDLMPVTSERFGLGWTGQRDALVVGAVGDLDRVAASRRVGGRLDRAVAAVALADAQRMEGARRLALDGAGLGGGGVVGGHRGGGERQRAGQRGRRG